MRWTNDRAAGVRFARWFGNVTCRLQLKLERWIPSNVIPWRPLRRPLSQARVAIVSTGGIHLCADRPFNLSTDATFRLIPRTASNDALCITHEHYDRRDAVVDPNLVFPLERLLELEAEGVIGKVADLHYGFGFVDDPGDLPAPGREVGSRLKRDSVDLALLVPA